MAKRNTAKVQYAPQSQENVVSIRTRNVPSNGLTVKLDHMRTFEPLTHNQQIFWDAYKKGCQFISLHGSAGTGKTFIAVYKALEEVMDKSSTYQKLVIVRSSVQSRDMGFMPGTEDEKMAYFEQPYIQICNTLFGRKDAYQRLKEQHMIEFVSTSFLRGCTFDDTIIIADEVQNLCIEELSTIMTRVGEGSKIIFCGDLKQDDLKKNKHDVSGLAKFFNIVNRMPEYMDVEFTTADIVRSGLVKSFILACEAAEGSK